MATATKAPSYIDPGRLYALKGFQAVSGVSATRIREARRNGIELTTLDVGRRKFVRGEDGIRYLYKLAELSAREKAAAADVESGA